MTSSTHSVRLHKTRAAFENPNHAASASSDNAAFTPPPYGINSLDSQLGQAAITWPTRQEAVQRQSAATAHTSQAPAGQVVQRLTDEEVGEQFESDSLGQFFLGREPAPDVRETIVKLTTAWEQQGKNIYHREWRKEYLKKWFFFHFLVEAKPLKKQKEDAWEPLAKKLYDTPMYWQNILPTAFKIGEDLLKPQSEEIIAQYGKLAKATSLPRLKDRIMVEVTMGQGAFGDLKKFIFHSAQFSSCSPLVMYNVDDQVGGLFHYAANDRSQADKLLEMQKKVKPTIVGMTPHTPTDLDAVQEILNQEVNVQEEEKGGDYYLYLSNSGELLFTTASPNNFAKYLNLTGTTQLPDEIAKAIPLGMVHEPQAYGQGFEVFPIYGLNLEEDE